MIYTAAWEKSPLKRILIMLIRILIICGAVYYIITSVDFSSLSRSLSRADYLFLIPAVILLPLNILLQYRKWELSCSYFLETNNKSKIWRSLFTGFSAAIFTPARTGEYVGRGIEFRNKKLADIASAVFFDKLYTLFFVILFGLCGALIFYDTLYTFIIIIFFLVGSLFLSAVKSRTAFFRYLTRFRILRTIKEKISTVKFPDSRYSVKMILLSFLFYTCYIIQFSLFIAAYAENYDIVFYTAAAALIMFVKTLVPNLISGELGIRESASIFFISSAGGDPSSGLNASLSLFLINIAFPAAAGLFFLIGKKND